MNSLRRQTQNSNILRIGAYCRDAAVELLSFRARGNIKEKGRESYSPHPNLLLKGEGVYGKEDNMVSIHTNLSSIIAIHHLARSIHLTGEVEPVCSSITGSGEGRRCEW